MSHEPSHYVEPDASDARLNRLWQNVSERLETSPARGFRWLVLSGALAAAAASAALFWRGGFAPHDVPVVAVVTDSAKLETLSDALAVTLNDGSSVKLASHSALAVRESQASVVSLALTRGEVSCDVTHREGRKFTVVAGDVQVRVVGTQFTVKTSSGVAPRVEVSVARGVVEVLSGRRPGVVARVAAGQSWIQNAGAAALNEPEPAPDAAAPSTADAPPSSEPNANAPKTEAPTAAASAAPSVPSARELFEKAGQNRRAGDAAAAARAYEELLRLHPSDGRASLSAFELGRLRMDRLGDPAGAITALERAVALNIGPSFREDALARLVSVYASQGNFAACGRARDRYLSSYPAGVHASAVAVRCGTR